MRCSKPCHIAAPPTNIAGRKQNCQRSIGPACSWISSSRFPYSDATQRLDTNVSLSLLLTLALQGKYQGIHFNQEHYETMGHCLCETLLELVDPNQTQIQKIVQDLVAK